MPYKVDIEINSSNNTIPSAEDIKHWISAALHSDELNAAEVSVYIVDEAESQALNLQYRGKNKPTNVLSFQADIHEEVGIALLGDLVVCAPVVEKEAQDQGKHINAHWAHMLIHGTLHLLGYDHLEDKDAEVMESLETHILAKMNFPAPYAETI
jgi:probable rRNA maturation factor